MRSAQEEFMNTDCATFAPTPRSLGRRLLDRLFPQRRLPIPEDTEGFAPSYMVTGCVCHLDWRDRLRVLVSGRVRIEIQTKTDVVVSRMQSQSVVCVLPPSRASLESLA
jgi:hypothetical protein